MNRIFIECFMFFLNGALVRNQSYKKIYNECFHARIAFILLSDTVTYALSAMYVTSTVCRLCVFYEDLLVISR